MYIIYKIENEEKLFLSTNGSLDFTDSLEKATKWKKKQNADNVLNNIPSKLKGEGLKVELLCEGQIASKNTEMEISFLEKVNEMYNFIKKLEDRRIDLKSEISNVELEIVDIEHYAEFNEFNAANGYKVYKMLHDARVKRRALKDEFDKIELILGTTLKSQNLENLDKSIKGLDSRKYTPRVLKDLFK